MGKRSKRRRIEEQQVWVGRGAKIVAQSAVIVVGSLAWFACDESGSTLEGDKDAD